MEKTQRQKIVLVVMGDVGHSPRMNYHALSLSKENYEVNLLGLAGSKPSNELLANRAITVNYMKPYPQWFNFLPKIFTLILKVFWQAFVLFFTLIFGPTPKQLVLQNPPAVPALPVCWFYCWLMKIKFYIDWHNYGFSIMALSSSKYNPLVTVYRKIEMVFGKLASGGFCVTEAMQKDLKENWGIHNIVIHYDKPHSNFHTVSNEEKHKFFLKMSEEFYPFSSFVPDKTVFTQRFADGRVSFNEDRPCLVVSSTSWTEDEDFSLFIYALEKYEKLKMNFPEKYPKMLVVITGKGPLKHYYLEEIKLKNWQHIAVVAPWLTAEDYPKLLASADIGVSLHYSSSGLDLPMKVVDMFGCGLPVMAIGYQALSELVKHNENGFIFDNKEHFSSMLQEWFCGFPNEMPLKQDKFKLKKNLELFNKSTWDTTWRKNVLPVLKNSK